MTTTSINPNDINLFAVDCSHNMRQSHTFEDGEFTAKRLMTRSSLDLALDYARYRIIQMVDRNLKTLHAGVLMFPSAKTKNVLTSQAKEAHGTSFDKKTDPYAHFREKIALDHPVTSMIPQLTEEAVLALADQREVNMNYADEYDDRHWRTDPLRALDVSIEMLDTYMVGGAVKASRAKIRARIYLLTDGESLVDWDRMSEVVDKLKDLKYDYIVVGINFDDVKYQESNKSSIKRHNESQFRQMVSQLGPNSIVQNASRALTALSNPIASTPISRAEPMKLSLGSKLDRENAPAAAIEFDILVKKAITPRGGRSMKSMAISGFAKDDRSSSQSQHHQSQHEMAPPPPQSSNSSRLDHPANNQGGNEAGGSGSRRTSSGMYDDNSSMRPPPVPYHNRNSQGNGIEASFGSMGGGEGTSQASQSQSSQGHSFPNGLAGKVGLTLDETLRLEGREMPSGSQAGLPVDRQVSKSRQPFYSRSLVAEDPNRGLTAEEVEQQQQDDNLAQPFNVQEPPETAAQSVPAYPFGRELIPMYDWDLPTQIWKEAGNAAVGGMIILAFTPIAQVRYDQLLGNAYYVYASAGSIYSQKGFSALVHALIEMEMAAIVRYLPPLPKTQQAKLVKDGDEARDQKIPEPKIGIFTPHIDPMNNREYAQWVQLPFAEDTRSFPFASLTDRFTVQGEPVVSHALLPSEALISAMDQLVDATDLDQAMEEIDGELKPWYTYETSPNPAIHNVANVLRHKIIHPDAPLPPTNHVIARPFRRAPIIESISNDARLNLIKVADIKPVPPKPKKLGKSGPGVGHAPLAPYMSLLQELSIAAKTQNASASLRETAQEIINEVKSVKTNEHWNQIPDWTIGTDVDHDQFEDYRQFKDTSSTMILSDSDDDEVIVVDSRKKTATSDAVNPTKTTVPVPMDVDGEPVRAESPVEPDTESEPATEDEEE